MGFVLDIIIAFLFRMIAKCVRRLRSRKWPTANATVFRTHVEPGGGFGCAVTTVSYRYNVHAEKYSASHKEPSISTSTAKYMAQTYLRGTEITVRYDPKDPSRSVALI